MNGIALLMLLSQAGAALGMHVGVSGPEILRNLDAVRPGSVVVTIVVVTMIFLAPRLTRKVPTLLCGLIAGLSLHYLIGYFAPDAVGPVVGPLPVMDFAPRELVAMVHLSGREEIVTWLEFLLPGALLLASVAALDGLLAAVVTDPVIRSRHDSNKLLKGQGAANALAAAFGAIPVVTSTHTSVANYLAGGRTSAAALFHALFMVGSVLALGGLIAYIPVSALAGVIIYTALMLVDRWTRDMVRRLGDAGTDRREILLNLGVVLGVTLALLLFNMIVAFAIGITAAVLMLLAKLSGSPVRRTLDGSVRTSLKIRNLEARTALQSLGQQIRIFELEGAIFFGTTDRLQSDVENLPEHSRYVILDFRLVSDIDASGAHALETIGHMAAHRNMRILLSHLREEKGHGRYLLTLGIASVVGREHWFADLDRALEWAEDHLLEQTRFADAPELSLNDMALFAGLTAGEMEKITGLLKRHELEHRDVVFNEGEEGDRLFLIARGSVSIKISLTDEAHARRLATFVPGVFFGEMAMIEGQRRSADAFANGEHVVLYSLGARDFSTLIQRHPQLGIKIYRNLSRELASRLRATSGALRALE